MSSQLTNPESKPPAKRFQFRLIELFAFVTAFCITFALLGRFGWGGLMMRLVGSLFFITPLILLVFIFEFYQLWRIQR
jgi:hypothetical protein